MPARRPHATAIAAEPAAELSRIARPLRLSEEVSGELKRRISRGEIKPGDRLPTEKALGEAFGVSRAVVREAIARLKADGLIETRQGSGAFAVAAPKAINLRFWKGAGPGLVELRDIFELRAVVEGAVAELAAQRRDENDLRAMREHLEAMDEALESGVDGTVADDSFHIALAHATHNAYIGRLVEFLGQHFSDSRKLAWLDNNLQFRLPQASQREHRALLDAIARGDAAAARRRALEHLRGAAGRLGIPLALDLDGNGLATRVPRKR
ncbi:FadR/GntR family transcriptional regulator [Sulfuritalea sp.]|uniref:FadR/GntR family transcriptional regulator n=1 Tax=Sulfuritalea sp. TaxID=2480090 RepID=UPI001AD3CD79|nr:FadR/GntR family transcriptional regulator [Sulfuritalea sp.]MBN8475021.1 FadR family transcriptional regulator [Sulfuritalea sp.]